MEAGGGIFMMLDERCLMFKGKFSNSIDAKGRMIVPAKFRDELDGKCVLTKGMDKCLYIYTVAEWEKFAQKLLSLPTSDPNARAFVRHFNASATDCEVDKQGRLTIPQEHRNFANISKELVTVGIIDKIEVWSKDEWEGNAEITDITPDEIAKGMADYGI